MKSDESAGNMPGNVLRFETARRLEFKFFKLNVSALIFCCLQNRDDGDKIPSTYCIALSANSRALFCAIFNMYELAKGTLEM